MTKRCTKFKRMKGDFYRTPESAVLPLLPHLPKYSSYAEPCAGDGALIEALRSHGHLCVSLSDIEPQKTGMCIQTKDAFDLTEKDLARAQFIITNPPWSRGVLHPMIEHFSGLLPTWLLFDADWMHTKQAEPYLQKCQMIVSVGRVSWMGNGVAGKDNAAWYLFDSRWNGQPQFVGKAA